MRSRNLINILWAVVLCATVAGCSNFRKVERSSDWKVKYEAALKYYADQDYYRAAILFEQILPIIRGQKEGEKVQYYLAYCNFQEASYLLSSHLFKTFYETYARSEFAEEANYMYAYSLFLESPEYNLDQSSSFEAIIAMQSFLNKYPNSKFRGEASSVINQLQIKLELKAYEKARQYFKLERFKSAIIAFENFRVDFPDSGFNEEIAFLKVRAQYTLAEKSISTKQKERYGEVVKFYENFIDAYPTSEYAKDVEKLYVSSKDKLQEM